MLAIEGAWPDARALRAEVETFWRGQLEELPFARLAAAVTSLIREGGASRPVLGQIYRRAVELADDSPDWPSAWREIRDRANGNAGRPAWAHRWSHPMIRETVQAFGWAEFCASDRHDEPTVRAQMRAMFESLAEGSG